MKPLQRVAVTGAAGQVAYSLLFNAAKGDLLGPGQPIALHLLDLPEMQKSLEGIAMELEDCAFPLLKEIRIGSDPEEIFEGVHYALLLGARPRQVGMERKDLLSANGKIFREQGQALDGAASRDVRVLVVGNPCNTNCLIALSNASSLPKEHFFALTRLDQNRTVFQLAKKAQANIGDVSRVAVWGNHSSTQAPDFINAKIGKRRASDTIDRKWLEADLYATVQKRGGEILNARGKSSAASAAKATIDAMQSILTPNDYFSMGIHSKGNPYGIDENLVFSFPCRSKGNGEAEILRGIPIDPFLQAKLAISQKELIEERNMVSDLLR